MSEASATAMTDAVTAAPETPGRPGRWPMPSWGYRHCVWIFLGTWLFGWLAMWAGVHAKLIPAAAPVIWAGDFGFAAPTESLRMLLRDGLRAVGFLVLLIALVATGRTTWRELGVRGLQHRVRVGVGVGLFAVLQGVRLLSRHLHPLPPSQWIVGIDSPMDHYVGIAQASHLGLVAVLVIGTILLPLLHVGFFQGLLYPRLRANLGASASVFLCAAAYVAVQHINLYVSTPLFVMGIFAAWLVEKSRSLWPPLAVIALGNATELAVWHQP